MKLFILTYSQWEFDGNMIKLMSIIELKKHVKSESKIDVKALMSIWYSDIDVTKTLKFEILNNHF